VTFLQAVYKISWTYAQTDTQMHGRTDGQPEKIMPPVPNSGGGI